MPIWRQWRPWKRWRPWTFRCFSRLVDCLISTSFQKDQKMRTWCKTLLSCAILWISFEYPLNSIHQPQLCQLLTPVWLEKKRIGESILSHVCEKLPTSLRFAEHIWVSWCDMFFDMIWYRDFLKLPASRLELGIIFSKVHGVGHKCCFYDHFLIHHEMKSTHLRTCQFQAHLRKCPDLPLMWYVLWHDMIWYDMICYCMVWYIWRDITLLHHILYITFGSKIYSRNNILDLDSKLRVFWRPSSGLQGLRQSWLHRFQPVSQIWKQPGRLISKFFWGNHFE